jgi:hypothetical protein
MRTKLLKLIKQFIQNRQIIFGKTPERQNISLPRFPNNEADVDQKQ